MDHDDELADQALELLYDYAVLNRSDVVVGREVRRGRSGYFPYGFMLFQTDLARVDLSDPRLLGPLSPHKMFRRAFLLAHHITFPETPRTFEDYAFVMHAYLCADVISVLATHPIYIGKPRADGGNAGAGSVGRDYRDTIDIVNRFTDSADDRGRLLAYWYWRRILKPANEKWASWPRQEAREFFARWQGEVVEHFPAWIDGHLDVMQRARSALLRGGDFLRLQALAAHPPAMAQRLVGTQSSDGAIGLTVEARVVDENGRDPLRLGRRGRLMWTPPADVADSVPPATLEIGRADAQLDVAARSRETGEVRVLPCSSSAGSRRARRRRLGAAGSVSLDETVLLRGQRLDGPQTWDLFILLSVAGASLRAPLRVGPAGAHAEPLAETGKQHRMTLIASRQGTARVRLVP